jgi:surface antigen
MPRFRPNPRLCRPTQHPGDYPFKTAPVDTLDPYHLAYEECTSYVAWRINRDARTADPSNPSFFQSMAGGKWGNATNWEDNATSLGYVTDHQPQVGAIAQWTTACNANGKCPGGHVAYVEAVDSNGSIVISEYNYAGDDGRIEHQYGVRTISAASGVFPQWFIHIPRLMLSLPSLNFGNQAAGTSTSQTITVTNSLSTAISLNVAVAPSVTGSGTTDFTESDNCASSAMAPGSECDVTVSFAPPATLTKGSARSASIVLNWGDGPQPIPVSGVALVDLAPSKKAISFGSVALGVTSAPKTVTLTNRTGADITVSSLASGQDFAAAGCIGPLVQGTSCTINVTFSPSATGQRTATLSITDSAIDSPQTVSLTGNGIVPVSVTPTSETFTARAVRTASSAKAIVITNNLPTPLAIPGIELGGANPGDFAVSANTCGSTLPAGATCMVDVSFTPTAKGIRTAILEISDSVDTQVVSLAGTGK